MKKLVFLAILLMGCAKSLHPGLSSAPYSPTAPEHAHYNPRPIVYETWWAEVEKCSHLTGDLDSAVFFLVPEDTQIGFTYRGDILLGLWIWPHYIYIDEYYEYNAAVVRHEMLHNLLQIGGHPEKYYCEMCKDYVVSAGCLFRTPKTDTAKTEEDQTGL